jgi:hypothetical protein
MGKVMFRLSYSLAVLACCTSVASAQQWAEKMFKDKSVDFGAVPRAAKIEHEFVFTNPYKEDIHVVSVRSSCGCTEPRVENETIKSREQGKIIAAFNTNAFTGQRGATVTVTIDKPQWAEVQLQVRGYIRTDLVLSPSQVSFGNIGEGEAGDKTIKINYAGRSDWKINEVKSNSPYVTATVREASRQGGRVSYELDVKLAAGAPTGYLNEQLTLVTNDRRGGFPVAVEGRIVPELTASPSPLMLGNLYPGQKVTKQLVIKGAKPFKILDIRCENSAFAFKSSEEAKPLHLVPVTFEAPEAPGKLTQKIEIVTDLSEQKTLTVSAIGQISAPLAGK